MNRDVLVGVGACLVVAGSVMRGLARSHRRDRALRKQHDLAHPDSGAGPQPDAIDRHLEQWLPRYGTACIVIGAACVGAGLFA